MAKRSSTSKIFTIIKHEYISKVRTKGFIIGTLLGPIIMLALVFVPVGVTMLSKGSTEKKIAILDYTDKIGEKIAALDSAKYFLTHENQEALTKQVLGGKLDGYLVIPENFLQNSIATVFTTGGGGIGFIESLERAVGSVTRHERLREAGADNELIQLVDRGIDINTKKLTEKGTEKDYTEAYAIIGYIFGFMIYILMILYGTFVMRGVIEEKANRIIEVLASSARPFEIMMGKVVGIGCVGLTQVLFWMILFAAIAYALGPLIAGLVSDPAALAKTMSGPGQQSMIPAGFEIPYISPWLFVGFIFYFLAGYFIYSTLFAAIGSAVDQENDAQQIQTPLTLLIVVPFLFIGYIITNPEGLLSVILSLIPFFAPILMIVRVASTDVPLWQIIASVVLLIATFFGCVWIAARIYRVGILMYGKKPNFKDLIKWIRLAR